MQAKKLVVPFAFFFNDTATTEIYTLSLHDALPISMPRNVMLVTGPSRSADIEQARRRSEEHTSELQSRGQLVCRLLLEKKKETTEDTGRPGEKNGSFEAVRPPWHM